MLALTIGCAGPGVSPADNPLELADVPFFPQARYQCGPAALATVLGASGVQVAPESLTSEVFIPGRRGSFAVELKAAARRRGRIPYTLPGDLGALVAEIQAERPVLVLQNLGSSLFPRWHYAVVVGASGRGFILRSGRTARRFERERAFARRWRLADHWNMVLLVPGEVPRTATPGGYLEAVVAALPYLDAADRQMALHAGTENWPDDADLWFAAANQHRDAGRLREAEAHYRRALALDADHPGALNNLADLLAGQGCTGEAARLIERALAGSGGQSSLRPLLLRTAREIERMRQSRSGDCGRRPAAPGEGAVP